ncbi:MAG: hypothetical protein ACSLEX_02540 [Minisyncoccota bacterium]
MTIFFARFFFILLLVFLEFSFFDILFQGIGSPFLLIMIIVAWTLIRGFPQVLFSLIPIALIFDIVANGRPSTLLLYAILLAYATSFLSRRLLVEHYGFGMVTYALFSGFSAIGYMIFDALFWGLNGNVDMWTLIMITFSALSWYHVTLFFGAGIPLFFCAYASIKYFEQIIERITQRDVLRTRS